MKFQVSNSLKENPLAETKMDNPDDEFANNVDEAKHDELLKSLGVDANNNSDSNRRKGLRTEATQDVSMFSLLGTENENLTNRKVHLHQLLKGVKESANVNVLKKQINRVNRSNIHLDAPLSRPVADRLQQKVEYEKTTEKLTKWDPIVQSNRKAEQLSFPLQQEHVHLKTVGTLLSKKGRKLTPLEEEIYALLNGNKCIERPDNDLTVAEEEALAAVSLEEAKERRAELQKHRALMSYHEQKSKRQKKIKSKQFHRILRKKKKKQDEVNAPAENPGDVVQKADKLRAEERASLRHRTGSKWAQSRAIMAKHDKESKLLLEEQLEKHKELVTKAQVENSDDSDVEIDSDSDNNKDNNAGVKVHLDDKDLDNPWLSANTLNESQELRDWLSGKEIDSEVAEKVPVDLVNTEAMKEFQKAFQNLKNAKDNKETNNSCDKDKNSDSITKEDDIGDGLNETNNNEMENTVVAISSQDYNGSDNVPKAIGVKTDASKVLSDELATSASKIKPDLVTEEDEQEQMMTIEQAFADDDVISEFRKVKNQVVESDQPKAVSLALPGWGEWAGSGIKPSKRKRRRFRVKPVPVRPRLDQELGHVVISEKRDAHIAKHRVNSLPFPFTNEKQFERTIAQPVGNTWNTPSAFQTFIEPKVKTTAGAIIPPMDSELALKELEKSKIARQSKRNARNNRKEEHQIKLKKLKMFL